MKGRAVGNAYFQFRRMDIDVDFLCVNLKMQDTKRKFMLHQILAIAFLHRLAD